MCAHSNVIEDFSTGDVICTECGLVMDKILLDSNQPRGQEKEFIHSASSWSKCKSLTIDFVDSLNIGRNFVEEILKNVHVLQNSFPHSPLPLLIAASSYGTLSKNNCGFPLSMFENFVCSNGKDKKKMYKMIVALNQSNSSSNQPQNLIETILPGLVFSFCDIQTIKKNIMTLECEHCSYNPLTVIGSHTFLTIKELELPLTIKSIASHVGISKNSIYSFIDPNKHSCVKTWDHVYQHISRREKISTM